MKTAWLTALVFASALWSSGGSAIEPYTVKPSEIAQMPDYCQAKLGVAEKQADWGARFGALWIDMHHYCHGLKFIQRASRPGITVQDRGFYLNGALGEFDYVLNSKNAPGHWFLPQIHLEKALVYGRMGQHAQAAAQYRQARAPRQ